MSSCAERIISYFRELEIFPFVQDDKKYGF
jgi:hypothetical protein